MRTTTHRHRRRALLALAAALAVVALTAAPASAATCVNANLLPHADDVTLTKMKFATLCLLNAERASRCLPRLTDTRLLGRAAIGHSRDMVRHRFFSHTGSDGSGLSTRIARTGYLVGARSWQVGENIAWGTGSYSTPAATVRAWMNSAGHRANILNASFRDIGFGIVAGNPFRPGSATYTTDFGVRR